MVYKKYVKRGKKIHGPYIYRSRRVKGKVISEYIGKDEKNKELLTKEPALTVNKPDLIINKLDFIEESNPEEITDISIAEKKQEETAGTEKTEPAVTERKSGKIFLFFFLFMLLIASFFYISEFLISPTGRVSLELQPSYQVNETIYGNLKLDFKHGELIPADSIVKIKLGNQEKETTLSNILSLGKTEGKFYAEGLSIEGEGQGYGFLGEKISKPEISFTLIIYEETEEAKEEKNKTEEKPEEEIPPVEEGGTEETTASEENILPEEASTETSETPTGATEPTAITGQVISETKVEGKIKAGEKLEYELKPGQTAEIEKSSVKIEDKKVSDNILNLNIEDNKAVVTTEYELKEYGFGEEYLTGDIETIMIDLEQFGLLASSGSLKIDIVYSDTTLISSSSQINVEGEIPENITETNITETNITANITEVNITETNITEANITTNISETNITEIENISIPETNITIPENISEINITGVNVTINTTQSEARIGRPVNWKKNVKLDKPGAIKVELPALAENINVYVIKEELEEVTQITTKSEPIIEESEEIIPTIGEKCNDTDGGNNEFVKGAVSYKGKDYEDYCSDKGKLVEYYCDVYNNIQTARHECEFNCLEGICLKEKKLECIDSDSGLDYYNIGSVCLGDDCKNDLCLDEKRLSEGYCKDEKRENKIYECEYKCENEKCIEEIAEQIEVREEVPEEKIEVLEKIITTDEQGGKQEVYFDEAGREAITGQITAELELEEEPAIIIFFTNLFKRITGRTITGKTITTASIVEVKEISIDENATEFEIEYQTPAPQAIEKRAGKGKKEMKIESKIPYSKINAHVFIEESEKDKIKVKGIPDYEYVDTNNDGLIDEIGWDAENEDEIDIEIEQQVDTAVSRTVDSNTYQTDNDTFTTTYFSAPVNVEVDGEFIPLSSALDVYASYDSVVHIDSNKQKLELKPYYVIDKRYYLENITDDTVLPHTHIYDNKVSYKYAFGIFNFSQLKAQGADRVGFEVTSDSAVGVSGNVLSSGSIIIDFSDIATDYKLDLNPGYVEVYGDLGDDLYLDPTVSSYYPNSTGTQGQSGWYEGANAAPSWTWGECDATAYSAANLASVSKDDAGYVTVTQNQVSQQAKTCHRYIFNISEDPATINNISVLAQQKLAYAGTGDMNITIGNFSSISWILLAGTHNPTSGTEYTHSSSVNAGFADYVNTSCGGATGGCVYVLLHAWQTFVPSGSLAHSVDVVQLNVTYSAGDSTKPQVFLKDPSNNTILTNSTVFFAANFTDDVNLINATLYVWNSTLSLINNSRVNTSVVGVANVSNMSIILPYEGVFYWNYYACDAAHNCLFDIVNYTLNMDLKPYVNFTFPTPSNNNATDRKWTEANVSITEYFSGIENITWNWNGTNYTMYNESVVLMLNFENLSALGENDTFVVDTSKHSNNGTWYGNDSAGNFKSGVNSSGRYGGGFTFDGEGDYINLGSLPSLENIHYNGSTVEMWVYISEDKDEEIRFFSQDSLDIDYPTWFFGFNGDGATVNRTLDAYLYYLGTDARTTSNSNTLTINEWQHVAMVTDSTLKSIAIYRNGVNVSASVTPGTGNPLSAANYNIFIGAGSSPFSNYFNGSIDAVRIWNRSLSPAEINQSYFSNLYKYNPEKWALYVNESGLSPQIWTYYACAQDSAGNMNCTEQLSVDNSGADAVAPVVFLKAPGNDSYLPNGTVYFAANFTDGTNLINATLYVWNSTLSLINNSRVNTSVVGVANISNMSVILPYDNTYYWNYYVCDASHNCAFNATNYSLTIDTIYPNISIQSPLNNTNTSNTGIAINYTVSGNVQACWYSNDTLTYNYSLTCGNNVTGVTWAKGQHNLTVYVNDSANNENSSSVTFNIDTLAPNITITYPLNTSYNISVSILNYTTGSDNQACWWSNDSFTNHTITCGVNISNMNSSEGSNKWLIASNDSSNNINSSYVTFVIDTSYPEINITYPSNTTYTTNISWLNYTITETNPGKCWFTNNSGLVNITLDCGTNFTALNASENSNTWKMYINDSTGKQNSSTINFVVDSQPPIILTRSESVETDRATISFTTDENSNYTIFYGTTFSTTSNTSSNVFSTSQSVTLTVLSEDTTYYYNITVTDILNHYNTTIQYTFKTRTTSGGGCSDACASGETEKSCVNSTTITTRTCGNYDEDSCREWSAWTQTACSLGCVNDNCVGACIPDWQCTSWSECFLNSSELGNTQGISGMIVLSPEEEIEGNILPEETEPELETLSEEPATEQVAELESLSEESESSSITGAAVLTPNCNTEGEKICHATRTKYYQVCEKTKGVLRWKNYACASGLICKEGNCVCTTTNACSLEGDKKCYSSTKFQTCTKQTNGCLKWSSAVSCATGFVCSNGTCVCSTTNACTIEGNKECRSNYIYSCKKDNIGCLKWVRNQTCARGLTCFEASCVLQHCVNNITDSDETGIDCGGISCKACPPEPILLEDQYLMSSGESKEVTINKGDLISVTYDNKLEQKALLTIKNIKTAQSVLEEETHKVTFDEFTDSKIKITVESDPITKEIYLGGTEVFDVSGGVPSVGEWIQTRTCTDNNNCNILEGKPEEVRACNAECTSVWSCTGWSSCRNHLQTRTCRDVNNCTISQNKPQESQECNNQPIIVEYTPGDLNVIASLNTVNFNVILNDLDNDVLSVIWSLNNQEVKRETTTSSSSYSFTAPDLGKYSLGVSVSDSYESVSLTWQITVIDTSCTDNWECGEWGNCTGKMRYRTCEKTNPACPLNSNKPAVEKTDPDCLKQYACTPQWNISLWNECEADYTIRDLIEYENRLQGKQSRLWQDLDECLEPRIETRICNLSIPIEAKKVLWCEEEYVEIREKLTEKLVSRVKLIKISELTRVDIGILITDFAGYCDYCFDKIKDYDETGIDCGGPSCPICIEYARRFNWWLLLDILLWLLLLILILLYITYIYKKEYEKFKEKIKIKKVKIRVGNKNKK